MKTFLLLVDVLAKALVSLALAFTVVPLYLMTFVPSFSQGGGIGYAMFLSLPTAVVIMICIELLQLRLKKAGYWSSTLFILVCFVAIPTVILLVIRALMGV